MEESKIVVALKVDGTAYRAEVEPLESLLDLLRRRLGITAVKCGCDNGQCGTCTVILDGKAVYSCLVPAVQADGRCVLTAASLAGDDGQLDPIQKAFIEEGAVQCGFCTTGMLMAVRALLDDNPHPTDEEIREGISGNLCRCTGYVSIINAVKKVAGSRCEENA